ncbi:MAG: hypothetical protein ACYC6Y_08370 [Thermoguttaceae bacterium]
MKTASVFEALMVTAVLAVSPTLGQRIQMPSKLPLNSATSPPFAAAPGTTSWVPTVSPVAQGVPQPAPFGTNAYSAPATGGYQFPSATTQPPTTFAQPGAAPAAAPVYAPQPPASTVPGYSYPPGVAPSYAPPGPTAQFQGTIAPAPTPGWDPYATPGAQNPAIIPYDPYLPGSAPGCTPPTGYVETMQRFMDEVRVDYVWMPGNGTEELGLSEADLSASFAFPFFGSKAPLMVTPGFATTWWNGPAPPHPPNPEFPPRLYDAYLDTAWNPQPTPEFGAELNFRIGIYSDFDRVVNESIRYTGKGYGVLSLSPAFKIKAGIQYLDRQKIKLLPAGGLIWTPNANTRFDILFPDPRLAWRLRQVGNVEWWLYGRGEYGGGSWTISDGLGGVIETDYNDVRVAVGMQFDDQSRWKGHFEVGYAFEREIYQIGEAQMKPTPTVFIGAGLAY